MFLPCPFLGRGAKHRQTLTDAAEYHEAAIKIQRHWRQRPPRRVALLRLINSEARRRHQKRPSFQMRAAVCEEMARDTAKDPTLKRGPSIWQLMQCSTVIKEVLEDVRGASKLCHSLSGGLAIMTEATRRKEATRSRLRDARRRVWPKLQAVLAWTQCLEQRRRAEVDWDALRRLAATPFVFSPKASDCAAEVKGFDAEPCSPVSVPCA
ncbi:unnamed protein product [Symbiodinium natans]|uniref:Uncharacterized protein n=1 Tax=Symbiodinium natans TaxID=878477 RepID=A0A812TCW9_9DINO|nr:unnamed protein product [Symbiodinium natans]